MTQFIGLTPLTIEEATHVVRVVGGHERHVLAGGKPVQERTIERLYGHGYALVRLPEPRLEDEPSYAGGISEGADS